MGSRAISKLLFPNVFRKETPMWIVDLMKVALSLSVVPIEV